MPRIQREELYLAENRLPDGGTIRFDFDTWLVQNYGVKAKDLTKKELALAQREYSEEYPPVGEGEIRLKTYPFKGYLERNR